MSAEYSLGEWMSEVEEMARGCLDGDSLTRSRRRCERRLIELTTPGRLLWGMAKFREELKKVGEKD